MDPIKDISTLRPGDVVRHPTHGFAVVEDIEQYAHTVTLRWERPTEFLPSRFPPAQIVDDYEVCLVGGFMARSMLCRKGTRELVEQRPAQAMVLLLDDVRAPLSQDAIKVWLIDRGALLEDDDFEAWWDRAMTSAEAEPLLSWRDETLCLETPPPLPPAGSGEETRAEAWLALTPRARIASLPELEPAERAEALRRSADERLLGALVLLLRGGVPIPEPAIYPLVEIAVAGDRLVAAQLLSRNIAEATGAFARLAASSERRPLLQGALSMVPGGERTEAVLALLERTLSENADEDTISFLVDELPGGPASYMGPLGAANTDNPLAEGRSLRFPLAFRWLQSQSSQATVDRPTTDEGVLVAEIHIAAPSELLTISVALARALALRHAAGQQGGVLGSRLLASGDVKLGPPEGSTPRDDAHQAVRMLLRRAVGTLPRRREVEDDVLLAHLAQLVPGAPPDWVAVATRALSPRPGLRPVNAVDLWEQMAQAAAIEGVRAAAPPMTEAHLDVAHDTHIGLMKSRIGQTNQDALYWQSTGELTLLLVADGISVATAGSGNLAAALLVQVVASLWEQRARDLAGASEAAIHNFLDEALAAANSTICEASLRLAGGDMGRHIPMGTTVVAGIARGSVLHLASLGDSRGFLVSASGCALLTPDQNLRGEWLATWQRGQSMELLNEGYALIGYCGHFDEEGQPSPVPAFHRTVNLLPGETILFATDGLTDYAAEHMADMAGIIEEAAREANLGRACRMLVDRANAGGGGDNITVLMARLSG